MHRARFVAAAALLLAGMCAARCSAVTKKALIIGIDGLRPDSLQVANTPNIDSLLATGAYSFDAQIGDRTWSGPGWSTILTGVWRDRHGVTDNGFGGANYQNYPDILTRLESFDSNLETVSLVHWAPINNYIVGPIDVDQQNLPDVQVAANAATLLSGGAIVIRRQEVRADADLMFLHFDDVDAAGHSSGWTAEPNTPYIFAIQQVDVHVGTVLNALRQRPGVVDGSEDWLVVLTSDHGGYSNFHGPDWPEIRTVPIIFSGASMLQGRPLYPTPTSADIVPTTLRHLGIPIDPAWELDGRSTGTPRATLFGQNLVFNGDAEFNLGYSDFVNDGANGGNGGVGATVPGWIDISDLSVGVYGGNASFPSLISPGPIDRGDNFFVGGYYSSSMSQIIDVADISDAIDGGGVRFELSGYFGGWAGSNDVAILYAQFFDEVGQFIASTEIGGVDAASRMGLTALSQHSTVGLVPVGARRIELLLYMQERDGNIANTAFADNLSLVLFRVPEPNGLLAMISGTALLAMGASFRAARQRK